jgi:hypothetical protein
MLGKEETHIQHVSENLKGTYHLGEAVHAKIILKWISTKESVKICN